jgi:hypothetical protein
MIRNSFIFLDRISRNSEKNIWNQGISDWDKFLEKENIKGISRLRKSRYDRQIKDAGKHLFDYNSSFFTNILPSTETWRLYDHFKDDCVFLDIETGNHYGNITVVGLFDGYDTKTFVRNINLNAEDLKKELEKYKLIVTFNGSSFDLPIINRYFNKVLPYVPHIDLRHCCSRLGLKGGLKIIEKQLGISRPDHLSTLNGEDAVWLWHAYNASGDRKYLNTLISYNEEDIVNLKPLMNHCYRGLKNNLISDMNDNKL